jgi:DNA-binding PadR family transcriptional regulator
MHGYETSRRIQQQTEADIHIEEVALYPALQRISAWITGYGVVV